MGVEESAELWKEPETERVAPERSAKFEKEAEPEEVEKKMVNSEGSTER